MQFKSPRPTRVIASLAVVIAIIFPLWPLNATPTVAYPGAALTTVGRVPKAPIGHRQPRAADLLPYVRPNEGAIIQSDRDIDRMINICRGC